MVKSIIISKQYTLSVNQIVEKMFDGLDYCIEIDVLRKVTTTRTIQLLAIVSDRMTFLDQYCLDSNL